MCLLLCRVGICCRNDPMNGKQLFDVFVYLLGALTAFFIVVAAFYDDMSFSTALIWHILFMAVAIYFLLAGSWAYKSDLRCLSFERLLDGEGASSWKGVGKGWKGKSWTDKVWWERRFLHGMCMCIGCVCFGFGLLFILVYHTSSGICFGYDFSTSSWLTIKEIIHAWNGYVVLLLVFFQMLIGVQKYWGFLDGFNTYTFHGTLGKVILVFVYIQVILGMIAAGFGTVVLILLSLPVLIMCYFAVTWYGVADEKPPDHWGSSDGYGGTWREHRTDNPIFTGQNPSAQSTTTHNI